MNIFLRLTTLLSLIGAAAIGSAATWLFRPKPPEAPPPQAPIISLEKMGQLVSVKVNYSDVVEFTEKRTLDIPWSQWELRLGGTKVLLVARGDCTVATNLSEAKYEQVNAEKRVLTIALPLPKPLQARINHDAREKGGSYFYAITNLGIEPIIPDSTNRTQAVNNALVWAQKDVERVCVQQHVLDAAKQNAENVLSATFQATGWTPTFVWK
jgi:hypothetical protein